MATRINSPQSTPLLYREMDFRVDRNEMERRKAAREKARADAGATEEDDELAPIPVVISSEKPVLRYDWWKEERYYEVLVHESDAVDLSYATDGLPFVMSHRSWDGDSQHGLVEKVAVTKERTLTGDLAMSRAQRSQEIADDIVRGIRKKVSVGYVVGDDYESIAAKEKDGIPTRRYTAWMPFEVSVVPVPADYDAAGFGRSATDDAPALPPELQDAITRYLQRHPLSPTARKAKERSTMSEPAAPAPTGAEPAAVIVVTSDDAMSRVNSIIEMANTHGFSDRTKDWVNSKKSALEVSREISALLAERMGKPVETVNGLGLSEKEKKRFSFARALLVGSELEREFKGDVGFEREIAEGTRKLMVGTSGKGQTVLPFNLGTRAGVDSGTASTGGAFKFTQGGDFIDLLRNKSAVMRLGATMLPGLTGPMTFPKALTAATAAWAAENPGSDASDSNLTTTTVSLAFKTIIASTSVSRQALFSAASGNYSLEEIIIRDLTRVIGLAIDLAAINGLGSSNQPLGILQNTSVGAAAALGANGGSMAWGNWVDLETTIGDANADGLGVMGYLTNTKQRGAAKKVGVLGNTASGIPIWQSTPGQMDGVVNGYRAIASNQVPRNLTKGTTSTVCSAAIFGAWNELLIGQFGAGFETLIDPYSKKKQNMIEITAWNFVDVALRYAEAFATIKDAL